MTEARRYEPPSSAGKPVKKAGGRSGETRAGKALRNAATTVQRGKSALGAYYRKVSFNSGAGVAAFATARKMATLVYRMLRWGQAYVDIGQEKYEERYQQSRLRSAASNAAQLGYKLVKLEAVSA